MTSRSGRNLNLCFGLLCCLVVMTMTGEGEAGVITEGLVAYYPFAGDAADATGGGNDGTVHGAALAEDQFSQPDCAYQFDGAQYIETPLVVQSATGTVCAWVLVDGYSTGYNQLNLVLGQWDNLQLGLGDSSLGADGQWVFRLQDTGGGMKTVIGPLAEPGVWVHVAGVWDGNDVILYLDGIPIASLPGGAAAAAMGPLVMGRHSDRFSQNYWLGKIDEVCVYDRALTPAEVAQIATPSPPSGTPDIRPAVVGGIRLENHPNPFNPRTTIEFELPQDLAVSLHVHDARGRLVRTLIRNQPKTAGIHRETWDGRGDDGGLLPSGVYFCRVAGGGESRGMRMTLVK